MIGYRRIGHGYSEGHPMAEAERNKRREARQATIWLCLVGLTLLASAPALWVALSPDVREVPHLRSLRGVEAKANVHFPPGTELVLSRADLFLKPRVIALLRMPENDARRLLAGPPFNGASSAQDGGFWECWDGWLEGWGPVDKEWQPQRSRHYLSAAALDREGARSVEVLVDLEKSPVVDVYVMVSIG